jgi:hypothetical protein
VFSIIDLTSMNTMNYKFLIFIMNTASKLGPHTQTIHKRTEGRAPMWGSEFTTKAATLQGGGEVRRIGALPFCSRGSEELVSALL